MRDEHPIERIAVMIRQRCHDVGVVDGNRQNRRAKPGNRLTDSVSCYGRPYNLLWFNNGYHQEHHFRPQVHWTRVPEVRELMLPTHQRRVVRGAHLLNLCNNLFRG